jgi:2-dehydro-3-deoxygluconokinase
MRNKSQLLFEKMKRGRLVALLNPKSSRECVTAYELCEAENIVLEIALRSPYALTGIKEIISAYPEALLLAGTVMTAGQARQVIDAGAAGVVSADYIPAVAEVCIQQDVMCIPGGLSDAGKQLEQKARGYGVSWEELQSRYPYQWIYKLFPAFTEDNTFAGLSKAWKGPFPGLTVLYTGGIRLNNIAAAAARDQNGIFCASALTRKADQPSEMAAELKQWKQALSGEPDSGIEKKNGFTRPSGRPRIVTMGELMLRLSPPPGERLRDTQGFHLHLGGAEANVAVSLAQFGARASFVSVFPDNDLGDNAVAGLRRAGVDTKYILRRGKRMGIYFLEHGHGPRPSKVVYDRAHSGVSELAPGDIDWDQVLDAAHWFHWSGITPALGDPVAGCLKEGLQTARTKGVTVSVDLNYRKKLWSKEKAGRVMRDLMPYVDVLIGNEEDPQSVFGIHPDDSDVDKGKLSREGYRTLIRRLQSEFQVRKTAVTLRESISATENYWSACLFNGEEYLISPRYHVWIHDRVGSGDAFAAGLIWSLLQGEEDQSALNFGVAAAVLKHTISGDFNLVTREEVERLAAGDTAGRVSR